MPDRLRPFPRRPTCRQFDTRPASRQVPTAYRLQLKRAEVQEGVSDPAEIRHGPAMTPLRCEAPDPFLPVTRRAPLVSDPESRGKALQFRANVEESSLVRQFESLLVYAGFAAWGLNCSQIFRGVGACLFQKEGRLRPDFSAISKNLRSKPPPSLRADTPK